MARDARGMWIFRVTLSLSSSRNTASLDFRGAEFT